MTQLDTTPQTPSSTNDKGQTRPDLSSFDAQIAAAEKVMREDYETLSKLAK